MLGQSFGKATGLGQGPGVPLGGRAAPGVKPSSLTQRLNGTTPVHIQQQGAKRQLYARILTIACDGMTVGR